MFKHEFCKSRVWEMFPTNLFPDCVKNYYTEWSILQWYGESTCKNHFTKFELSIYVSVLQYTFGVKLKLLFHMSTTKKVRGIPGHTVTSNVKSSSYNKLQVQIKILLFHLLFCALKSGLRSSLRNRCFKHSS